MRGGAVISLKAPLGRQQVRTERHSVDPQSGLVLATFRSATGRAHSLPPGCDWTSNEYAGTVSRIDPATEPLVHTYAVGASPGVADGLGCSRFATRPRADYVVVRAHYLNYVDPATAYNPISAS
jgi:hypothetical protein